MSKMQSRTVIACEDEADSRSIVVDKNERTQQIDHRDCVRVECQSQWNALVDKEQRATYKVQHSSARPKSSRTKLCDWAYQFMDSVGLDRGIVSITFSYFDRYVYSQIESVERKIDLVFMTSLYLAIKIHSFSELTFPAVKFSEITDGKFDQADITDMEISLLGVLGWHVNPPVPAMFLSVCNELCNYHATDKASLSRMWATAKFLIELSVYDVFFVDFNPSSAALAAVSVAANIHSIPADNVWDILDLEISRQSEQIELCTKRLQVIYNQWNFSTSAESKPVCHSPTGVSSTGESAKGRKAARRLDSLFQAEETRSHGVTERMSKKRAPSTV